MKFMNPFFVIGVGAPPGVVTTASRNRGLSRTSVRTWLVNQWLSWW